MRESPSVGDGVAWLKRGWHARASVGPASSIRLNFAAALARRKRGETSCRGWSCRAPSSLRAYVTVASRNANRDKRRDLRVRVSTHSFGDTSNRATIGRLPFVHRHAQNDSSASQFRVNIFTKHGGCSMTIFPCREDKEAEDEENGDSRKDGCPRQDRQCRARELGDEWRTVETSLTRKRCDHNSMMWKAKWSRFTECFCRRPGLILVLLPCLIIVTLYLISGDEYEYDVLQYPSYKSYNVAESTVDGYLVWNPKCHMLSKKPLDPSIAKFVRKEKLEKCPNDRVLSQISREPNGSVFLLLDPAIKTMHSDVACCWSSVVRPKVDRPKKDNYDSTISVKQCENITEQVVLPREVEVAYVSCKVKTKSKPRGKTKSTKLSTNTVYENVHAILNPEKVRERIDHNSSQSGNFSRKLSVLVLGIDSVSRLNFYRAMPKTERYLRETGWIGLKGYNKIGDNTFPNLMAILTGQTPQQAYSRCKPTVAYKLDNCPFLWHNFRNAGYVTAYGEDETVLNTFNYLKVGFVEPPTDYYLRPYMLASEKLLKIKKRFNMKYCTGPELSFERIFDYAMNFAQTFVGVPYFGFFWTNTISHDNMNGISSMDTRVLKKFEFLEQEGILNDSMIIFLSDHGMRWGEFRNTFVGWYEERLPYIYIWLPEWFRRENSEAHRALAVNQNRLTSPFDLYETLRDVLAIGGGDADSSSGCSTCQSLFAPVPRERGCQDAGVVHHWCTCTAFKSININDKIATGGVRKFLDHVESIVKNYKDKKGRRLCARLKLKKVHRVDQVIDFGTSDNLSSIAYFYMIQTAPGNGNFEVTIRYHGNGNYTLSDSEVSRINPYAVSARCLNRGMKQYCHCMK